METPADEIIRRFEVQKDNNNGNGNGNGNGNDNDNDNNNNNNNNNTCKNNNNYFRNCNLITLKILKNAFPLFSKHNSWRLR